jgi:glycosyltransferase involved in cell wall biosynthesis
VKVIFNLLDANVGGGQRVAAGIAQALIARGHTVGVAVPADRPALRWFTDAGATAHVVDIVSLRRPWGIGRAARVFRGYDLVYSHTSVPGTVLGGAAAALARRPHVIHQHAFPYLSSRSAVRRLQRALFAATVARGRLIAVARHIADAAAALGAPPDRITVIPNGVEIPALPAPRPTGDVRVGLLARLDPQKGIDVYLDAVERVTAPASFVLGSPVPEDDFGHALHARARAAGVEIVAPAGTELLATLDIVAAPSLLEGHPLTLMEAMAFAKPVVAAAVPGVTELLEGTSAGILVPASDAEALAAALDVLVLDADRRSELGMRARELVTAEYSLPAVHARVIALLEEAAGLESPPESSRKRRSRGLPRQ